MSALTPTLSQGERGPRLPGVESMQVNNLVSQLSAASSLTKRNTPTAAPTAANQPSPRRRSLPEIRPPHSKFWRTTTSPTSRRTNSRRWSRSFSRPGRFRRRICKTSAGCGPTWNSAASGPTRRSICRSSTQENPSRAGPDYRRERRSEPTATLPPAPPARLDGEIPGSEGPARGRRPQCDRLARQSRASQRKSGQRSAFSSQPNNAEG